MAEFGAPQGGPTTPPKHLSYVCGACPPPWGPPNQFPPKGGCPLKGALDKTSPKQPPRIRECCPPGRNNVPGLSGKFQKVPKLFRHPPKYIGRVPKLFRLDGLLRNISCMMVLLRNISGISETFPVFSPELFHRLRNFSGDFLSDSLSRI